MKREYVVSFQLDNDQSTAKGVAKLIERGMVFEGSSLTSKSDPSEDWTYLNFNVISTLEIVNKQINEVFDVMKQKEVKLSCTVNAHTAKLIVNQNDSGNDLEFGKVLEKIAKEGIVVKKIEPTNDDNLVKLTFESASQRNQFKSIYLNELTSKGVSDGYTEIDWVDDLMIDKNNFATKKKNYS